MRSVTLGLFAASSLLLCACMCGAPVESPDGGSGSGGGGSSDAGGTAGGAGGGLGGGGGGGSSDGGSPSLGESCVNPHIVPITWVGAVGTGSATGSLVGALDDRRVCGATGRDVVYRFTVDRPATLTATVTPLSPAFEPAVALQRGCPAQPAELACIRSRSLYGVAVSPGTYDLWVDATTQVEGAFGLSIVLMQSPDGGYLGDDCATPLPLFDGGSQLFGGSTVGFSDNNPGPGLVGAMAPDLVYAFSVSETSTFDVNYYPLRAQAFNLMYLTGGCGGPVLRFRGNGTAGKSSSFTGLTLPVGSYHLWLDGQVRGASPFELAASLAPADGGIPPGQGCSNPIPLQFDGGFSLTAVSPARFLNSDSACPGIGFPDVSYSFTLDAGRSVMAEALDSPGGFNAGRVTLRRGCTDAGIIACDVSGEAQALPAGDYVLVVDNDSDSTGFYLKVVVQ